MESKNSPQAGILAVQDSPKMSLEHALLSEDPLYCLDLNVGRRTEPQRLFHLMFAALFEVSSGAVSHMFARFDRADIDRVFHGYRKIGAHRICGGIEKIAGIIERRLGAEYSKDDLQGLLSQPEFDALAGSTSRSTSHGSNEVGRTPVRALR